MPLTSELINSVILAIFYFGVATGAFFCNKYKIYLSWDAIDCFAYIHSEVKNNYKIKLSYLVFISFLTVLFTIKAISLYHLIHEEFLHFVTSFIYACVFLSAFIFEIISVAIIDRIGLEEKRQNYSGMIMRTYGLMGVGATIGFWLLGITDKLFISSCIILVGCLIFFKFNIIKNAIAIGYASAEV